VGNQVHGRLSVFLNRGTTFDQEIRRAIQSSDRLLLVVEPGALASSYVSQEWGFADDLGLPIISILRSGTFETLPDPLRSYHTVDARPPRAGRRYRCGTRPATA
jgi:hypothetical protein